jgi:excisionase family DNA binding protein
MTKAAAIRHEALPPPTRRGLHREEAAAYVGVSPNTFDRMVADGLMPTPRPVYGRKVWDVRALDRAFDSLPGGEDPAQANPWD